MIKVVTEEMHGSDRVPDLNTDCERALVGRGTFSTRAKWRALRSAWIRTLENGLDTADIVREACFRQLTRVIFANNRVGLTLALGPHGTHLLARSPVFGRSVFHSSDVKRAGPHRSSAPLETRAT